MHFSLNGDDTPLGDVVAGPDGSIKTSVTIPDGAMLFRDLYLVNQPESFQTQQENLPLPFVRF